MAQAKAEQMAVLMEYQDVRAPFDGVVTARFVDPGAMIQDAGSSTSAQPIVTVAQPERLRIFAYVDQTSAPYVKEGTPVDITLSGRAELKVTAQVTRIAQELDPRTRMMLTETDIDNPNGRFVLGSFLEVTFHVEQPPALQIPLSAVVVREDKLSVPVVRPNNTIQYREVTATDNNGYTIQITSGLRLGEIVALDIGDSLLPGTHVRTLPSELRENVGTSSAAGTGGGNTQSQKSGQGNGR